MKEKDYKKLLNSANDLYDEYLYLSSFYDENKDKNTLKALKENEVKLKEVLSRIDDILTIDMSDFVPAFMEYLKKNNNQEYELQALEVDDAQLLIAKPASLEISSSEQMLNDMTVYVLGLGDKKVLSHPCLSIDEAKIPTISILSTPYDRLYFSELTPASQKYKQFLPFMKTLEKKQVEKAVLKKNNSARR